MKKERNTIIVGEKRIVDRRKKDPGYEGSDILFCPVDIVMEGKKVIGKAGYSDQRDSDYYQKKLKGLIMDTRNARKTLSIKTITIEEATKLGLAHKPFVINLNESD